MVIDEMKAGHLMDSIIEYKLMRLAPYPGGTAPKYSSDVAMAMELLATFKTVALERMFGGAWTCTIGDDHGGMDPKLVKRATADTVPLAICRAALLRCSKDGITVAP